MALGGKRRGAGRPKGTGKFGVETKAIRMPTHEIPTVLKLVENNFYRLPFYTSCISAGFPSPADDEVEDKLNLNELLIKHPFSTFFLKVSGHSMIKAGIHDQDILIVDRSLEATNGKIVIASVNGELTVKRLLIENRQVKLVAENDAYQPIHIKEEMEFCIWGVVINVIHYL